MPLDGIAKKFETIDEILLALEKVRFLISTFGLIKRWFFSSDGYCLMGAITNNEDLSIEDNF